jgi:hypothetical protein
MAGKLIDEAKSEARRSADSERVRAESEVQSLLARRDFLLADVDHLEQYILAQRERLRDAAVSLQELVERVPGGLGDMRRPLLSASADSEPPASDHPASYTSAAVAADMSTDVMTPAVTDAAESVDDEHTSASAQQSIAATIDDVWRSLGEPDSSDARADTNAATTDPAAFDFGMSDGETPISQPRPGFDIGGDDLR